jgi:hypothetical protein
MAGFAAAKMRTMTNQPTKNFETMDEQNKAGESKY